MGLRTVFTDHSLMGFGDAASILVNKALKFSLADVHQARPAACQQACACSIHACSVRFLVGKVWLRPSFTVILVDTFITILIYGNPDWNVAHWGTLGRSLNHSVVIMHQPS